MPTWPRYNILTAKTPRIWFVLITSCCIPQICLAQPKPGYSPSSTHIFPAGGRRGTQLVVRIGGECLPPGASFHIDGQGVSAPSVLGPRLPSQGEPSPRRRPTEIPITYPKQWQSKIEIATNAPLGTVLWRLSCAQGGTSSRPFVIGDLPEFVETESNSKMAAAEMLELPVTVNGQICEERDEDYFQFVAEANQTVTCEVIARRIGSPLNAIVQLLDGDGNEILSQSAYVGNDPVQAFSIPSTGAYFLRVANVSFHGNPSYVYRLNLSTDAFVHFAFPPGGQRSTEQLVEFFSLTASGIVSSGRRRIFIPEGHGGASFDYRPFQDASNYLPMLSVEVPHRVENEPNDALTSAEVLQMPLAVSGQFAAAGDEDWYRFVGTKDQRLTITCQKSLFVSGALPTVVLTGADGKELESARCTDTPDGICRIDWVVPESSDYFVRLRDLRFGVRGAPDYIYTLTFRRACPDFALRVENDCLNVVRGKDAEVEVAVTRTGGFVGEVELEFEGLPKGLNAINTKIGAKQDHIKVKLTATDDAHVQSSELRIVGRATMDGQTVRRPVRAGHLGSDSEGIGVGRPDSDRFFVTVVHEPVFRLYCAEAYQYAHRGTVFPYPMRIERLNNFAEEIRLQLGDRQNRDLDGIEMIEVSVPPEQSEVMLPIYLPETMHINIQSQSQLYAQAHSTFTDKHGRPQSVLVLSEKRNMLRTLPPVVKLKAVDGEVSIRPGQSARCRLRLERTDNFQNAMSVSLVNSDEAEILTAGDARIEADARETQVEIRATATARPGVALASFRATGMLDDRIQVISETTVKVNVLGRASPPSSTVTATR